MKGMHEQLEMYLKYRNIGFPLLNIVDPIKFDEHLEFKDRYFLRLIFIIPLLSKMPE